MVAGSLKLEEESAAENRPGHRKFQSYALPGWVQHPLKPQPRHVALIFPGEQNHYVGMLTGEAAATNRDLLAAATNVLGFDVCELMMRGSARMLAATGFNQPVMYVANSMAYHRMLREIPQEALECQAVAGFSVGELSALYAAGVITFEQGLQLVKTRAEAMQELADSLEMEALVVRGVPLQALERQLRAVQSQTERGAALEVFVSRHWCPGGYVCAGLRNAILRLQEAIERSSSMDSSVEVRLLPNHLHAGHTPLAATAAARVAAVIDKMLPEMKPPRCELYLNCTGQRVPPGAAPASFAAQLKNQLEKPVRWDACVSQMLSWGVRHFYECGPNRSLKFMMTYFEFQQEAPHELLRPAEFTSNVGI